MPEYHEKTQDPALRKRLGDAETHASSDARAPAATQLDLINDWLAHTDGHTTEVKAEAAVPRQECNPEQSVTLRCAIQKRRTITAACTKPAGSPRQAAVNSARQSVALSAPLYLSVQKVALRYDVSVSTIWRWVKARRFPEPRKIAASITRWAVADLDAYDRSLG